MNGCKMNGGIITVTSPYSGDTEVDYMFEIKLGLSQLNNKNFEKQLNIALNMPIDSEWFSVNSVCLV